MSHLQLDAGSRLSLRDFRAVRVVPVAVVIFYAVAVWVFGAPRAHGLAMLVFFIGWFAVLAVVGKRIRCPYCTSAAVESFSPSWLKVPPFGRRIQCAHCQEHIDVSGGASPPSNISLERR